MEVVILLINQHIDVGRSVVVFKVKFEDRQLLRLNGQIMAEEIISLSKLNANTISAHPTRWGG